MSQAGREADGGGARLGETGAPSSIGHPFDPFDPWRAQVLGIPRPKGSKRALLSKRGNKPILLESGGKNLSDWRRRLSAVFQERAVSPLLAGPVQVDMTFVMQAPKTMPRGRIWPVTIPDLDKLVRTVLDELIGVVIVDDRQVVVLSAAKVYGPTPGVTVKVVNHAGP